MIRRSKQCGLAAAVIVALGSSGALAMGSSTPSAPEPASAATPAPVPAPAAAPATPSSGDDWAGYERAVELIEDGRYQDGIDILQSIVAENPANADAYNYLGYAHRQLGRYDEALGYYDQALSINPDHVGAIEYLGQTYLSMGDPASAQAQLSRLGQLCPSGCVEQLELARSLAAYRATN